MKSSVTIGDDICAVMLKLDIWVTDQAQHPIAGAEAWRIDEPKLVPPEPTRAERLGLSDAAGHISVSDCYMGSSDFAIWQPETEPVRFLLMIVREGYGAKHIDFKPPANDVVAAGNLLGVPPGSGFSAQHLKADPNQRDRGYVLSAKVVLVAAHLADTSDSGR